MIVYTCVFSYLFILSVIEINGTKIKSIFKLLTVCLLVVISGFRYEVGDDYNNYVNIFRVVEDYAETIEIGFALLNEAILNIGGNVQMLMLVCAIFTIVPIALVVNKEIPRFFNLGMSIYVYSYIYFEGMNTIRQALAMSLLLVAIYLLIKKKINPCFFGGLVVLGALFHTSAIFIGLFSFLLIKFVKRIHVKVLLCLLFLSFILGSFIVNIMNVLSAYISFGIYDRYLNRIEERGVSSGFFRLFLNVFMLYIVYLYHRFRKIISDSEKLYILFFVISVITYNLFFKFYIALRFYWYFYLFSVLVIPIFVSKDLHKYRLFTYLVLTIGMFFYTFISLNSLAYNNYTFNFNIFN